MHFIRKVHAFRTPRHLRPRLSYIRGDINTFHKNVLLSYEINKIEEVLQNKVFKYKIFRRICSGGEKHFVVE